MTSFATQFGEVGASIEKTLKEHADRLKDHHARHADQQNQIGAMNVSVNTLRREVLERIETAERTLLASNEENKDLLERVLKALGTNGSGGHHV